MSRELVHPEVESLLGAYALNAVDGDEAEIVESHLRSCPRCRAEVADHREVAARMAYSGGAAPVGVWSRIEASLEEGPPPLRLERVVEGKSSRLARRPLLVRVASVAAAIAIATLGVRVVQDSRRIDQLSPSTQQDALLRAASSALVDPHGRRVSLRSADGRLRADAVVLADGVGYLVKGNVPTLAPDQTYQLWALIGTGKISAGVLGPQLRPTAFRVVGDVWGLALTQEHAGGVTATKNQPVLVGQLDTASGTTPPTASA